MQQTFEQGSTDLLRHATTFFYGFIRNNRRICSYMYRLQQLMVYILKTAGHVNDFLDLDVKQYKINQY